MPTIRDRILAYIKTHPDGADDDELAAALSLTSRQQANACCRQLDAAGLIIRQRVQGKIRNVAVAAPVTVAPAADSGRPWFWEGNVQSAVIQHLALQGYTIVSAADTASHQTGKDIVAAKDGRTLWVTVKGYPKGTERTNATLQAAHWFKDAVFDMVVWRGDNPAADLGLALPDYSRYRKLAERVRWLQAVARFSLLWVSEDGRVDVQTSDA